MTKCPISSGYFPCKMDHATHTDALHLLFHSGLVMSIKLFAGIIRNLVHPQGSANHHAHTLYLSRTHQMHTLSHHRKTLRPVTNGDRCLWPISKSPILHTRPIILLIDTCAEVSVIPPSFSDRRNPQGLTLHAANNTSIHTYSTRSLSLVCAVFLDGFSSSPMWKRPL